MSRTAATLERKQFALDTFSLGAQGHGSFSGYASVFHGVDSQGDTVVPGAYAETIPKFLTDGFIAWGHDDLVPVAYPTVTREDERGLYLEASFHSTPAAQEARQIIAERLTAGKRAGISIGYYPVKAESGPDGTRRLLAIDLVEASLVMAPADDNARVVGVKAHAPDGPSDNEPDPEDDTPTPAAGLCGHGTPWDDHVAAVLTTLAAATHEAQGLYIRALAQDALERKEGRKLSAETRSLLQQCIDAEPGLAAAFGVIKQLLADTAPPAKGYRPRLDIRARELRLAGILEGVPQ